MFSYLVYMMDSCHGEIFERGVALAKCPVTRNLATALFTREIPVIIGKGFTVVPLSLPSLREVAD